MIQIYFLVALGLLLRGYASYSGIKDALIYAKRGAASFPFDEHRFYKRERWIVILAITVAVLSGPIIYENYLVQKVIFLDQQLLKVFLPFIVMIGINYALSFSFYHNGFYAEYRHRIDGAYTGFKDGPEHNREGHPKVDFNYNTRSVMEIGAWVLNVVYLCYVHVNWIE